MKSLNRYNSASELGASYGLLPTLSVNYIEEKDSVFITDKEKYFYVQSLEDGNVFSFGADTWLGQKSEHISYSKDSIDWFPLSSVESLTINAGEYIILKSDGTNLQKESDNQSPLLTSSLTFNAFGNLKEFLHPNDELQDYGYDSMFKETKVVDASRLILPATTLADWCYYGMFRKCTSLTTAPELPATTLASYCYYGMFNGCTALTTAPELPVTTLAYWCYREMFFGCSALNTAPELPATTLAGFCYASMFSGCSALTSAPALPATTLAYACYLYMFHGCTSLTSAPALPATTLADWCYYSMFYGCSKLSSITCYATNISADNPTIDWVAGVASSGTFYKPIEMTSWTTGVNGVPEGWTVQDSAPNYVTFTAEEDSTIGLTSLSSNQKLWYSKDQSTWSLMDTTTSISLASGESVYIAGLLSLDNRPFDYTQFKMTGKIAASGNCNALWNYIDVNAALKTYCGYHMFEGCSSLTSTPELPATTLAGECYQYMFNDCTSLATAPTLPATTLADYCYDSMFCGCTSLTTAPEELPATTLAYVCYYKMFYGCTSLTTAPALPATRLISRCYAYMFYGCTSLTTAPALPATKLAGECYDSMFYNCTSLITAPELPATNLVGNCYPCMFYNCTSLTTAPALPATSLAYYCYYDMFNGCTSLTTAPELPATTLASYCYYGMFQGCNNLSSITCHATDISANKCTTNWVNRVASSGTFTRAIGMDGWTTGVNGIPEGWTVQDYVES